jgi:hypothetical protein
MQNMERFEEDLTDVCRRYAPFSVRVTVGDALLAPRTRTRHDEPDPLTDEIAGDLRSLLGVAA